MFYTILPAKQGARGEFHHIAGLSAQVSQLSLPFHQKTSNKIINAAEFDLFAMSYSYYQGNLFAFVFPKLPDATFI